MINDYISDGLNFFAIRDVTADNEVFRLSGGAPANSIFLSPSGKLGIGTNNPTEQLTVNGDLSASGTVTPSDSRLKKNIESFTGGLGLIQQMNPVKFKYTEESGIQSDQAHLGLIAQDLLTFAPYLVRQYKIADKTETTYLAIVDSEIKYLLINAVKDQQNLIQSLQNQVNALQSERDEQSKSLVLLEERLAKIETAIQ
ncbi:MAG: tail fiber domain-containing protein [Saprospiraceae bacterium]|nr:tail fiber domain-containing protein [Saprospiraceae bacterium]